MKNILFMLSFIFIAPAFAQHVGVEQVSPLSEQDVADIDSIDEEIGVGLSRPLEFEEDTELLSEQPAPPSSLTDNFAPPPSEANSEEGGSKTWLNSLKNIKSSGGSEESLEAMMEQSKKEDNKRSNASVFDISGLMLRMSVQQAESVMQNRGYKKVMARPEVPNFIKWRNEELCRAKGVIGYERLANCVLMMAKKDGHEYIEVENFVKYDTQEEIEVRFTSNFTGNKVYRISYKSMAPNITGNSQKAVYIRNIKIYDFWKKMSQKYGAPDDREKVIWGLGGNKPYMQASTGYLVLEDPMLRELDYTRMSREDQRYMNTNMYSF